MKGRIEWIFQSQKCRQNHLEILPFSLLKRKETASKFSLTYILAPDVSNMTTQLGPKRQSEFVEMEIASSDPFPMLLQARKKITVTLEKQHRCT